MTKGRISPADRQTLDYLARFGYARTAATLASWRRQGALPDRAERGGGRGRSASDPPETRHLALGICRYLDKRQGIRESPELPRRRRAADAPFWLWLLEEDLDGLTVPNECIRDRVSAYYVMRDERFALKRNNISAIPVEDYERPIAAADAAADGLNVHKELRPALAVLSKRFPDSSAHSLSASAISQFFQALQGVEDLDTPLLTAFLQFPFLAADALDAPVDEPVALVMPQLSLENIIERLRSLSDADWRAVRVVINAAQQWVLTLSQSPNRAEQKFASLLPLLPDTRFLIVLIAYVATSLPVLRRLLDSTLDIQLPH